MKAKICVHCCRPIRSRSGTVYAGDDDAPLHARCYAIVSDPEYWEHLRDEAVDRRREEREAER